MLHDQVFWHTLVRTIIFTIANVGLTIVLGMLLALLLARVAKPVRLLLTAGLVLVWSMPQVVAVQVWYWITNYENGVLNYILTELHFGNYYQHDWYGTTFSQLSIVTALIVWGALPFVAITLYAALSQVPHELVAGRRDRRREALARLPRRDAADHLARAADPDEPLDPLGLRRLRAAVPADRPAGDPSGQLPDGRLRLRAGLLRQQLRASARRSRS